MMKRLTIVLLASAFILAPLSCTKEDPGLKKVMILYSCAYNNLSTELQKDVDDLANNRIPIFAERQKLRLLVFIHASLPGNYSTRTNPVLLELYKDAYGNVVRDTLVVYPDTTSSASAYTLNKVLTFIKYNFPSREYGLVFSSHATGWLAKGCNTPQYEPISWSDGSISGNGLFGADGNALSSYVNYNPDSKTIGAQFIGSSSNDKEIEARDFAEAIPMHMKYIAMDACLAGGIEIAYELQGKTDYYISSAGQIMTDGFPYDKMTGYLLFSENADVKGLAKAFYEHYAPNRYATISTVDCNRLRNLANVCKNLADKYREALRSKTSPAIKAQRYDGQLYWPYFYDLEDIFLKIGISESEKAALSEALSEAVVYKAATKESYGVPVLHHCGLSMFLPAWGLPKHTSDYVHFKWNKDSGLVR